MRQFNDRDGRWRVWLVPHVVASTLSPDVAVGGEGWLCFESVENDRRHRLPTRNVPAGWDEGADIHLRQLLAQAKKASDGGVLTKAVAKQRREVEDQARGPVTNPASG